MPVVPHPYRASRNALTGLNNLGAKKGFGRELGMKMEEKGKSSRPDERSPQQLYRDIRAELKKVIWPTGRQTVGYTGFVVVAVVVVAVASALLDTVFTAAFSTIFR